MDTLKISSTNINGIDNEKLVELQSLVKDSMDIILLSETHLRSDQFTLDLKLDGYVTYREENHRSISKN